MTLKVVERPEYRLEFEFEPPRLCARIVGGRDTLTPPEAGEWLSRTMGSAGLLRID